MQKGVIFPTQFLIHNCTSTANILIMLNATKKARENQDSKKDLVQHVLITVLVHYLTRHGSSKIFLSLVFIFHTCRMCCEVYNRLSSRQMWDKSGPTSNGDKPCHAGTLSQAYHCHVKCFEEKCRCRAYQIWQKRCELLDEDRFSAPKDFVNDAEYTYFDMNREFLNLVRQTLKLLMIFTLV